MCWELGKQMFKSERCSGGKADKSAEHCRMSLQAAMPLFQLLTNEVPYVSENAKRAVNHLRSFKSRR
jgi:hypothetical protein